MKSNCSLAEIADVIRSKERFVVMSHVRPDGDAFGCQIAMGLCLKQLGKQVRVWNQDGMLDKYRFLPSSDLVETPPQTPEEFDVAIALDTAAHDRLGTCLHAVKHAGTWINIDHHVSNNRYGDLAYIDTTAPATGQILYELIRSQDLPLTYEMADNLFVAISTDTGSFQYPNTTARSYEIGAELIKAGVNVGKLSQQMYESHPAAPNRPAARIAERVEVHMRRPRGELCAPAENRRGSSAQHPRTTRGSSITSAPSRA